MSVIYIESNDRKLYQINEKGDRILVCSTESEHRAFLRFTNKTSRSVNIWWRDYMGTKHHYLCLEPGAFADINTYISHPWEFTDVATNENLVVNNCVIFRAPAKLGDMLYRTNWNISVSLRSLRFSAMLVISEKLSTVHDVKHLGLPKNLEQDLKKMVRGMTMETENTETDDI